MKPLCIVSCPIDTFSGYGARSRDFVKSLLKLKNNDGDIFIMPQKWGDTPQNFLAPDDDLRSLFRTSQQFNGRQPDIWVQITIPSEFQPIGRYNIGVTAGIESTAYPGDFIEGFNRMNMNLVSSEHSRKVALTGLAGAGLIASRKKPVKPKTFNIGINLSSGKRSSEPSKYALKRQELLETNPKKVPNKNIA